MRLLQPGCSHVQPQRFKRSDNHLPDTHMAQGHAAKRPNPGALQLVDWYQVAKWQQAVQIEERPNPGFERRPRELTWNC